VSSPAAVSPIAVSAIGRARRFRLGGGFLPIWVATVVLFAVSPLLAHDSLSSSAVVSMLPFAAILAIAAAGQTLVIQQGGLDFSVPGAISLAGVLVTTITGGADGKLPLALAVIFGVALLTGLLNSIAVTRLGITPLVATIGVNAILIGTVLEVSGGSIASEAPPVLTRFAGGKLLGIPTTVFVAVGLLAVLAILLRTTVWGRRFDVSGANPRAARVAGVAVGRYQLGAYVGASLLYAVAGVLLAGFLGTPSLFAGDPYLLSTIAVVVLGGTALGGGRGSVMATGVGALFLSQLQQVVLAMGAANAVQNLIQGAIIALSMGLRTVSWRRRWRRTPSSSHTQPAGGEA
jgi:ribose transport system permease protein